MSDTPINTQQAIAEYLFDHPDGDGLAEITAGSGCSSLQVAMELLHMRTNGEIARFERKGHSYWKLTRVGVMHYAGRSPDE